MNQGDPRRCVTVIGGGAAGMMASIAAARAGAKVTLLERGERVGRKLLATGNGQCNLANMTPDLVRWHGASPDFVAAVLAQFDLHQTLAFFRDLGIAPVVDADGRVYPRSRQASAVLDVLRWELEDLGVQVRCLTQVRGIGTDRGRLVIDVQENEGFEADRVVLAAGGRAAPHLGATDSGYNVARALGHRVIDPFPALVQVRLRSPWLRGLAGTRFEGAVRVLADHREIAVHHGEILFTPYGVSGNAILDGSRVVGEAVGQGQAVSLSLAVVDDIAPVDLAHDVARRIAARPKRPLLQVLTGLVHKKLIGPMARDAGIEDPAGSCGALSKALVDRLCAILRDWRFEVIDVAGWDGAQVAAGGIDTSEVDPKTLASRRVPGLHFAGEVLDVDGDCGGFNLQWAWSSGWVAGTSAASARQ